jgi:hypothetical protein
MTKLCRHFPSSARSDKETLNGKRRQLAHLPTAARSIKPARLLLCVAHAVDIIRSIASSINLPPADQLLLLRSRPPRSTPLQTMPECLRGGCGSPVRLDDYYWVYFEQEQGNEQKQVSRQKRKRKRMPRACKARKRYTQQGPHKGSRSNEEVLSNGIVCITSLEPLRGKYLVWTDSLGLGEA